MILAIVERIENITNEKPFNNRYYLTNFFKEIFDELDILLFPVISEKNLEKVCKICDGLIVTGSSIDIPPKYYNEKPIKDRIYAIDEFKLDKKLINIFAKNNKPILGICGGLQSINVCFGGSLYQKIDNHNSNFLTHKIQIEKNSFLYKTYNTITMSVNSFHSQSIKSVADGFIITAKSEDGVIEAIEKNNIIGVQWHPEQLKDINFFKSFIKEFFI